ncbi:MAG: efflux transporter outer membrane subunit [Planctomycetes bacterium]|nr:efflux transporter outer membrane subunit [Planctomycetota bacterium]
MNRQMIRPAAALVSIAGCMVGPDYQRPDVQVPTEYHGTAPTTAPATQPVERLTVVPGSAPVDRWWTALDDEVLDSLVDRAIQSNIDLELAEARVREARAQRQVIAADLWPQFNLGGSHAYRGSSLNAQPKTNEPGLEAKAVGVATGALNSVAFAARSGTMGSGSVLTSVAVQQMSGRIQEKVNKVTVSRDMNLFQAGFDASWELDIFGGTRRAMEAAEGQFQAAQEDLHNLQTTLISEVALNYVEARGYQKRLAITRQNIETMRESLELTRVRFQAGLTSELDVAQAAAQLATTESQVPVLEALWHQAVHRLGVLLGRPPGALLADMQAQGPIPAAPPAVPVGLPSGLLRRRPDIRRSERQLAAATAQIGVAVADLYPRFSITGSFGTQTRDMQHFLDSNSLFWSIGPGVSWPIFEGGRIRANIKVQTERERQAFALYHSTILTALEDVENALVAYRQDQQRWHHLGKAVDASHRALEVATERYRKGLADFLSVLESQRSLYLTQDQLAQSEADVVANYIALNKALGGGWQTIEEGND